MPNRSADIPPAPLQDGGEPEMIILYVEAASREGSSGAGSNLRVCVFVLCSPVVLQGGFWYRVGITASAVGTFYREKTLCSSAALFPDTNSGNWVEKRFRLRIVLLRENSTGLTWPLWWQSALSDQNPLTSTVPRFPWLIAAPSTASGVCVHVREEVEGSRLKWDCQSKSHRGH